MSNTKSVPETLTQIDPAWLSDALRAAGVSTANIVEIRPEPLLFTGSTTDMARLRVTYENGADCGPASMVAKMRGRDEFRAGMDAALSLFARESRFYADFASDVPVRTPRVFAAVTGTRRLC